MAGSIEKRGKGSWRLTVEAGYDANNKRIRRRKSFKGNKREAEKELARFVTEVEAGEYIAPEKMKLSAFIEEWEQKHAINYFTQLSLKTKKHHLKNHILPYFGHMRLDQIKSIHVVTFLDDLNKSGSRKDGQHGGLASGTIQSIYGILKNIFTKAKEWQLIKTNPMELIKKPKVTTSVREFYDTEEAHEVVNALYKEPLMWRLFFLGAMLGGFRRGELLALEWKDINFKEMTINVDESISLTLNGQAIIGKPKTNSSIGEVPMPSWYMEELKKYHYEWKLERIKVGDQWQGGDRQFVFHVGFGKPIYHTTPSKRWVQFTKRHGLKYIRLHDLRHSSATLLIEAGSNMKEVQTRLRHSTFQTTSDIYAHVTKNLSRVTAEKFDIFNPKTKNNLI
jgi:integrase